MSERKKKICVLFAHIVPNLLVIGMLTYLIVLVMGLPN